VTDDPSSTIIDERAWRLHPVARIILLAGAIVLVVTFTIVPLPAAMTGVWRFARWWGISVVVVVLYMVSKVRILALRTSTGPALEIRYGAAGWPRQHFPSHKIASVTIDEDIKPRRWGGWGYRGSLTLLRRAGLISRRGEGVVVTMSNNARLAITIDDPASFARHFA